MARSACRGVIVAVAELFPVTGSNGSASDTAAGLVLGGGLATWARSVSVAAAPLASEPTFQRPDAAVYVPWLGLAETNVSPAGNKSDNRTPVALFGPLLIK